MSTDFAQLKEQIQSILDNAGIEMAAQYVPSEYDPKSKEFQGIKWKIVFKSKRGEFATNFTQGIGHLPNYPKTGKMPVDILEDIKHTLQTGKICRHIGNQILKFGGKPISPPHPADVISCLLTDSSAEDYATFEDWANEMGYDPDSRKAEAIWQACLETSRNMNRVIGHDVIEALRGPCSEL